MAGPTPEQVQESSESVDISTMLELASVHMPKAAGTALRIALQQWYGEDFELDYDRRGTVNPGTRAVHGHFPAGFHAAERTIVWLREPARRLISQYFFWVSEKSGEPVEEEHRMVRAGLSLEEFAELPQTRNVMTLFVNGWDLDRFAFVGIFEDADREMERLATVLEMAPVKLERVNVTAGINWDYPKFLRSPEFEGACEHIRRLNELDVALYAEAEARRLRHDQRAGGNIVSG